VPLSCSSIYDNDSSYKPENILTTENAYWLSQNRPNYFMCLKFNSRKNKLSGYLLHSWGGTDSSNPKNWKVEASNYTAKWTQIDQQVNCHWINQDFSEVYFPIEAKEAYSCFKFTQTGKNYNNKRNFFILNFIEFFGTIFEQ
jgi:hypothetical protein